MREQHMTALGALRLHHRGEPREPAAALTVRPRLVAHQVDVVGQDEGDKRGIGICRRGRPDGDKGGEQRDELGGVWRTSAGDGSMRMVK